MTTNGIALKNAIDRWYTDDDRSPETRKQIFSLLEKTTVEEQVEVIGHDSLPLVAEDFHVGVEHRKAWAKHLGIPFEGIPARFQTGGPTGHVDVRCFEADRTGFQGAFYPIDGFAGKDEEFVEALAAQLGITTKGRNLEVLEAAIGGWIRASGVDGAQAAAVSVRKAQAAFMETFGGNNEADTRRLAAQIGDHRLGVSASSGSRTAVEQAIGRLLLASPDVVDRAIEASWQREIPRHGDGSVS